MDKKQLQKLVRAYRRSRSASERSRIELFVSKQDEETKAKFLDSVTAPRVMGGAA